VTLALDMLMDAEEAPAAKRRVIVEIARGSVRHLVRMIEDLLLVSSSETGKMKVVVEPLDLSAQIAAIVEAQRPAAAARGAAIELSAPAGLWGRADPTRLRQVLANLIDNALKFTPAGGRVRVTASVSARDKGFVAVSVSDEGPGIPEPERERVFERHFQSSAGVEKGGLGLGLAICRELVTRQGGRIWADAGERGAVLTFTLPAA
jgi:signal transduction histidine kinase